MNIKHFKQIKKSKTILFSVFLVVFYIVFQLWKINKGFIFNDEPSFIGSSQRLYLGDALLVDDWFPAQLIGFINYPFYCMWLFIKGSVTGIILFYRYCYLVLWTAVLIIMYFLLRKQVRYTIGLLFGLFFLGLFAPLDEMTLSYNFWCLSSLLLIGCLQIHHKSCLEDIISGVFSAIAILACPHLIVGWAIYSITILFGKIICRGGNKNVFENLLHRFLYMFLGILPVFLSFIGFIFSRSSFGEILISVPNILNNSGYNSRSILTFGYYFIQYFPCICISCVVFLISVLDKHRESKKVRYFVIQGILAVLQITYTLFYKNGVFNSQAVPLSIICLQLFVFYYSYMKQFLPLMVLSIVYGITLYFSSYTGVLATCMPLAILSFIAIIGMFEISSQYKFSRNRSLSIHCLVLVSVVLVILVRTNRTYIDAPIRSLGTVIETGAAKGIVTTSENAKEYEDSILRLSSLLNESGEIDVTGNLLILKISPALYLDMNLPYGTYSSFITEDNGVTIDMMKQYYYQNPAKIPTYIYVLKDQGFSLDDLAMALDLTKYSCKETEDAYFLLKITK